MVKFLKGLLRLELEFKDSFYTLWCDECHRLCLGCPEHWFCGLCKVCAYRRETEDLDFDEVWPVDTDSGDGSDEMA